MSNILLDIYIISFLDSFNYGLLMPVLNTYILSIGGTHIVTGILGSLHVLSQILSKPIVRNSYNLFGKKITLVTTLIIGLICNILIGQSISYWAVVLLRVIFYLTNQTQSICKIIISEKQPQEKHNGIYAFMGGLYVIGFILGPIISGYIYASDYGIFKISISMALCSIMTLLFSMCLPTDTQIDSDDTTLTQKIKDIIDSNTSKIKSIDYSKHLYIILLKVLTTIGLTVFFMKYAILLGTHYKANSIVIGYTVAYQSIIIFISNFVINFVVQRYYTNALMQTKFLHCLSMLSVSMISICYASSYELYLFSFIPLSLSRVFLESLWKDLYKANAIEEGMDGLNLFVDVLVPICFGFFCYVFTHHAVKFFAIVPILLALFYSTKVVYVQSTTQAEVIADRKND